VGEVITNISDFQSNQILKHMRGGNYPAVSDKDVVNIQIPIIDISDQVKIIEEIQKIK